MGTRLGFVGLFYGAPGVNRTNTDGDGWLLCCRPRLLLNCFLLFFPEGKAQCTYTLGFGQVLLFFSLLNLTFLYDFLHKTIFKM